MNYKNIFINKMNENSDLRIYLMAHNTEWYSFDIINQSEDKELGNERICIHGNKLLYKNQLEKNNYDLFLSFNSDEYDEIHEEDLLKTITEMAIKNQKNVTYGYEYYLPDCERTIDSSFRKLNIKTVDKEGKIVFETSMLAERHSSALSLANITSYYHFEQLVKGMTLSK